MTADNQKLLERLTQIAEKTISLCKTIPHTVVNRPIITQLIKCITSIGANYSEACSAESSLDFVHKIKILLKESRESKYFLRLLKSSAGDKNNQIDKLISEVDEIIRIFNTIVLKFNK